MTSQLYQGDCLTVMQQFEDNRIDLIYLDPPFFTQKVHRLRTKDRQQEFSFADLWSSHAEYADFLHLRLKEMWRLLSPTGAIFFHCDRNASHITRILLNEVFGTDMFRSEIIWHYRRWSNSKKGLLPAHQTIFYYTKSSDYTFNLFYQDYSPSTNVDQILQRRKRDRSGKSIYERDQAGKVVPSGGKKGVPLSDVWDMPYLNPKAKERVGYPTQKPILLLERIIKLATNEGDVLLDPFCGSGTTLVAASLLARHSIGIDISSNAIQLTRQRLQNPVKTESSLLKKGRKSYKNANQEALALLTGMDYVPVQRNKGIDAILSDDLNGCPIPVRVQRPNETIPEAAQRLYRAAKNKRAAVMFLIATKTGGYFPSMNPLPPNMVVIDAPSLSVSDVLTKLRASK
jgi:site-specific DNA-methyltransferase (adenine-specific)